MRRLRSQLLPLLQLLTPLLLLPSSLAAPEYIGEAHRHLLRLVPQFTRAASLTPVNTVRALQSDIKMVEANWMFVFNASCVQGQEALVQAELFVFRKSNSRRRRSLRLTLHAVARRRLLDTRRQALLLRSGRGWQRIDVTPALRPKLPQLLAAGFEKRKRNGKVRGVSLKRFVARRRGRRVTPYLLLHLHDAGRRRLLQLRPQFSKRSLRRLRHARSPATGHERRPRLRVGSATPARAPADHLLADSPANHRRRRRRRRRQRRPRRLLPMPTDAATQRLPPPFNFTTVAAAACHLLRLRLHFADLASDDWLLRPKSVPFHVCAGTCLPMANGDVTNHAELQSLLHKSPVPHFPVPSPSCVPIRTKPQVLVLLDENLNAVLKVVQDLTATDCGCR